MSYCWTILLPLIVGFIFLIPCIIYSFDILPYNNLLY
jgi:NADH-ubiquinone oxidoreductase chain 1